MFPMCIIFYSLFFNLKWRFNLLIGRVSLIGITCIVALTLFMLYGNLGEHSLYISNGNFSNAYAKGICCSLYQILKGGPNFH